MNESGDAIATRATVMVTQMMMTHRMAAAAIPPRARENDRGGRQINNRHVGSSRSRGPKERPRYGQRNAGPSELGTSKVATSNYTCHRSNLVTSRRPSHISA